MKTEIRKLQLIYVCERVASLRRLKYMNVGPRFIQEDGSQKQTSVVL